LDCISTCLEDWHCQFTLSDPIDEDFISACNDHEHTELDETVERCDKFFNLLLSQSQEYIKSKDYPPVDFMYKTKDDNGTLSERHVIGEIVHKVTIVELTASSSSRTSMAKSKLYMSGTNTWLQGSTKGGLSHARRMNVSSTRARPFYLSRLRMTSFYVVPVRRSLMISSPLSRMGEMLLAKGTRLMITLE
jgi:hypothetical protein